MEKKLKRLFDYQRFEQNPRLAKIIRESENAASELADDDLFYVSAAGTPDMLRNTRGNDESPESKSF